MDTLHPARAARRLALMHCVSGYPVENQDANLRRMDWLGRYAVPVGYSGHEKGTAISVAAVARGACIVERHLTLDRTMAGPDHAASLEPEGFRRLVRDIRKVEAALGPQAEQPLPCEMSSKRKLRKCTVAARDLSAGTVLGNFDVRYKSPEWEGAVPADRKIWGKKLTRSIGVDEPIMLADLI
jgi:sialic acid synthase SpsE